MGKLRPLADHPDVGPFRIRGILGSGGQGNVYLGERRSDGQLAAVKVLHFGDGADAARRRLRREIISARRVPRHWTAGIIEADVDGDIPYIATEYIDGETLHELVARSGPLPPERLHRLAVQTIDALEVIHAHKVVHRDFKPGNVMRGQDGWVVIDFGIARVVGATHTTENRGTYAYMAPEQIRGDDVYATDLFAWGATMVFAATGRPAFEGRTEYAVMNAILEGAPHLHGLDGYLGDIVRHCLRKDPSQRPTIARVRGLLRIQQPARPRPAPAAAPPTVRLTVPAPKPTRSIPVFGEGRRPVPVRPPVRPRTTTLAYVTVCALVLAGAIWGGSAVFGGEPNLSESSRPAVSTMPAALRAFATGWPHASFTPTPPGRDYVTTKWVHSMDGVIVSVLSYRDADHLRIERRKVKDYWEDSVAEPDPADWRQGTAANPAGRIGTYVEYQVKWLGDVPHASIWWDGGDDGDRPVLILQTPATDPPQRALDHLREVWDRYRYTRP